MIRQAYNYVGKFVAKNMQKVGMSTSHLAIYVVFYYGFYIVDCYTAFILIIIRLV